MGSCHSSNGASGGSTSSAIQNALARNKVDLEYAQMKVRELGNVKGGGTRKTQELFRQWNDEAKRLQEEKTNLETQKKAIDKLTARVADANKIEGQSFTNPTFTLNNDGNINFEYMGTKMRKHEKGGKMQSATKADTVEVTTRYYGVIRVSGDKMRIERHSETVSEKIKKRGKL